MLLAYVDESYTQSTYWIAALICPEAVLRPLAAALDSVVKKASDTYEVPEGAELHGYALFHGKDDWVNVKTMARTRIGVYNEALNAIGQSGASIIIRGVDRRRLEERYVHPDHPHAVVLEHLSERVDEFAATRGEYCLMIADEVEQADLYRRNLWRFQRSSTMGYRSRRLTQIVDTLHFAPSAASRLVQAADLIAFLWCRIASGADTDERAKRSNIALWQHVKDIVAHNWQWYP